MATSVRRIKLDYMFSKRMLLRIPTTGRILYC